jgi:flagellin-like hook-associated protein FlgL
MVDNIKIKSSIQNILFKTSKAVDNLSQGIERLSTGLRINTPSDDPADSFKAAVALSDSKVYTRASKNIFNSSQLIGHGENALKYLDSLLVKLSDLAKVGSNSSFNGEQRTALNTEANNIFKEYQKVVSTTEFNSFKLLDGSINNFTTQAGLSQASEINVSLNDISASTSYTYSTTTTTITPGFGDGTYKAFTSYAGTAAAFSVFGLSLEAGDVNGDGINDIVTLPRNVGSSFNIFIGNGDGTFKNPYSYVLPPFDTQSIGFELYDTNGDTFVDIVYAQPIRGVSVLMGNSNGIFYEGGTYGGGGAFDLERADVNGDGVQDIIASNNGAHIFLGNSNGTFSAGVSYQVATTSEHFAVADFNSDGFIDIATSERFFSGTYITYGNGDGTFKARVSVFTPPAIDITVEGDFNGDGLMDLALGYDSSSLNPAVYIAIGNGDGTFKTISSYQSPEGAEYMTVYDINNDNRDDLVVGTFSSNVNVFMANSNGTFTAARSFVTAPSSYGTSVSDFNNDGIPDIATLSDTFPVSVSVLLGNGTATAVNSTTTVTSVTGLLDLSTASASLGTQSFVAQIQTSLSNELSRASAYLSRLNYALSYTISMRDEYKYTVNKITEIDAALELSEYTKDKILSESATALLVHASLGYKKISELLEE